MAVDPDLLRDALPIGALVADRCQGNRKPGSSPDRYERIRQAAVMGAYEALKRERAALSPTPHTSGSDI